MIICRKKHLLFPLLALSMTLATAASVHAQGTSATLQINFGTTPHWTSVSGTRVEMIPMAERPGYDVFRYGGSYYAYNNNRWYSSRQMNGQFTMIDDRSIPNELTMVPRENWRNYPSGWQDRQYQDRQYQGSGSTSASLQVNFGNTPHWTSVGGTRVEMIPMSERPGYDVFRYGGSYYAYNNNRWYSSRQMNGQFDMIDDQYVPNELTMVPREDWRNYPSGWRDRQNQGSDDGYATLQVSFNTQPRLTYVPGTRVRMIRQGGRSGYDMFRYGRNYYVYNNNHWYMSRQWRGQFNLIDDRSVPRELSMVPRRHWRNYPSAWMDANDNSRYGRNGQRR